MPVASPEPSPTDPPAEASEPQRPLRRRTRRVWPDTEPAVAADPSLDPLEGEASATFHVQEEASGREEAATPPPVQTPALNQAMHLLTRRPHRWRGGLDASDDDWGDAGGEYDKEGWDGPEQEEGPKPDLEENPSGALEEPIFRKPPPVLEDPRTHPWRVPPPPPPTMGRVARKEAMRSALATHGAQQLAFHLSWHRPRDPKLEEERRLAEFSEAGKTSSHPTPINPFALCRSNRRACLQGKALA